MRLHAGTGTKRAGESLTPFGHLTGDHQQPCTAVLTRGGPGALSQILKREGGIRSDFSASAEKKRMYG